MHLEVMGALTYRLKVACVLEGKLLTQTNSSMSYSHISAAELRTMDQLHKKGEAPTTIIRKLQGARQKAGDSGPSKSAVYEISFMVSPCKMAAKLSGRLPPRLGLRFRVLAAQPDCMRCR